MSRLGSLTLTVELQISVYSFFDKLLANSSSNSKFRDSFLDPNDFHHLKIGLHFVIT